MMTTQQTKADSQAATDRESASQLKEGMRVGLTMVFFHHEQSRALEEPRERAIRIALHLLQRFVRGWLGRLVGVQLLRLRKGFALAVRAQALDDLDALLISLFGQRTFAILTGEPLPPPADDEGEQHDSIREDEWGGSELRRLAVAVPNIQQRVVVDKRVEIRARVEVVEEEEEEEEEEGEEEEGEEEDEEEEEEEEDDDEEEDGTCSTFILLIDCTCSTFILLIDCTCSTFSIVLQFSRVSIMKCAPAVRPTSFCSSNTTLHLRSTVAGLNGRLYEVMRVGKR
jgi:hypothetical protein